MAGTRPQGKRRPTVPKEHNSLPRERKQLGKPAGQPAAAGEEDFPRGGADTLTALERRELTEAALKEVEEVELGDGKQPKRKKARITKSEDDQELFFGKEARVLEGKLAKHVELLRVKNLHAGTRVWGMVLEVTPRGLVISLPHGLRGHVTPNQASDVLALMLKAEAAAGKDSGGGAARKKGAALLEAVGGSAPPLTDLFAVGQFVRCVVVEAPAAAGEDAAGGGGGGRSSKHVKLSLLLRDVQGALSSEALVEGLALGAVVRSVEDHGYVLSFGIKGTSGFLRKKDHEAQFGEGMALQVGGLIDVVVRNAADKRNVIVSCAPGDVAAAVTHDHQGVTGLDTLLPGALLNIKVKKVLSNGLLVSFLTFFHGTVDMYHLPAGAAGDWRKTHTEGAKLRARLLYVDPTNKRTGLSMLPHLLALALPNPVPMLGSVFPEAEIERVDTFGGPCMLLKLDGLPEGPVTGYCHVANALEEEVDRKELAGEMAKKFKIGAKFPARVIGYRLLDGMASVTVRPNQVNAVVLSYTDLAPGMLITGTVLSVPDRDGDGMVRIQVAEGVVGVVPRLHASELPRNATSADKKADGKGRIKVKVGDRVETRVLDVDPSARRLVLTLRKALLTTKAALLVSAAQAAPGSRFHGIVTGFHDRYGVFVSFFANLNGVAPYDLLGLEHGQSAKDVFTVGQVLRATIISAIRDRIKLSLASKTAAAAAAEAATAATPAAGANGAGGSDDSLGGLQPGDIVEAVIVRLPTGGDADGDTAALSARPYYACRLEVPSVPGGVPARLDEAHLADHPAVLEALRAAVQPGTKLGRVVVLQCMESQRGVWVSRKPSLVAAAAAGTLPRSFDDVKEGAILSGFVGSVTSDAVYVRFPGGLTGRAGLPQLCDMFVRDPRQIFSVGQSVRGQVATCDAARKRFTVLLKPSATASSDGAYLLDYFREMLQLQVLRARAEAEAVRAGGDEADAVGESDLSQGFPLGSRTKARVHEIKDYGIVCDLEDQPDLVGLIPSSQVGEEGTSLAAGTSLDVRVMDVVGHEGLVEISIKPEMLEATKDKAAAKKVLKKLKPGDPVEAIIEGIRRGEYLILSLPQHASLLAYAALTDYNTPKPDLVPRTFNIGQRVSATVAVMPPDAPSGRILCHVPLTRSTTGDGEADAKKPKTNKADKKSKNDKNDETEQKPKIITPQGSVVEAVITGLQPDHLDVSFHDGNVTGRIHITEVVDVDVAALTAAAAIAAAADPSLAADGKAPAVPANKKARKAERPLPEASAAAPAATMSGSPLDGFRLQQTVKAVVLGRLQGNEGHLRGPLELSLRPSRLEVASKGESQMAPVKLSDLKPGQALPCFVLEAASGGLWVGASPAVRGRVSALDVSMDPNVLCDLPTTFPPGKLVLARVLSVNSKRHKLDLSLVDPSSGSTQGSVTSAGSKPGALVMGRILAVNGKGVRVGLGGRLAGSIALTDIHDYWVPDALEGLKEGMFVRVRVMGQKGDFSVLSLRPSHGGAVARSAAGTAAAGRQPAEAPAQTPDLLDAKSIKVGEMITGYVTYCDGNGLYMALDRFRSGRIRLVNLSDGFIEDPIAAFPVGMRLEARVVKVDKDGRVDLSLRKSTGFTLPSASTYKPGQLVSGSVRRVLDYGVFVELDGSTTVTAFAHISQLDDRRVEDPSAALKEKQLVKAVVLSTDEKKNRVVLSLKPSIVHKAEKKTAAEGRATKRKRTGDIDDEMAEAADDDEDSDQAGAGDIEAAAEEEDDDAEETLDSDVDVDDLDVSDDENRDDDGGVDDEEDGDREGESDAAEEEEEEQEDEEEEEDGGRALARSQQGVTIAAGNLDLTAPWGEMLLADDPRVSGGTGPSNAPEGDVEERKLSKGQKKRLKEQREQEIRAAELARLSGSAAPTTASDFERLALSSPNSSFVWIKYMALHLSHGDVDSARKVAQRALDAIHYREEGEKFNVWVAWLNLENAYGTNPSPEEAAMEMLKKALQYTDQKKMYLAALGIFERSGREDLAEQVLRTLTKKFGGSAKVWARAIECALQKDDGESSRKLLERALQSLPARKHIKTLVRAALAEFRLGSAERGRGILEGVLRNYPKRLDLWNVYIDQELKTGEQQRIRALFERATHLPLPPKKMKFLFRRYLEYEKSEGDAAAVEHVKRRAMEFVENSLKA